jgi:hypothetical protein
MGALILPGMVSNFLYIVSEYERVIVLKLGNFTGVKGPGRFWVIPYPPFNESVAAQIDLRIQTRVITAAETLTDDNVPVGCERSSSGGWKIPNRRVSVANYREAVSSRPPTARSRTPSDVGIVRTGLGSRDKFPGGLRRIIGYRGVVVWRRCDLGGDHRRACAHRPHPGVERAGAVPPLRAG